MKHLKNIIQQSYVHRASLTNAVLLTNLYAEIFTVPLTLRIAPPLLNCQMHNNKTIVGEQERINYEEFVT